MTSKAASIFYFAVLTSFAIFSIYEFYVYLVSVKIYNPRTYIT